LDVSSEDIKPILFKNYKSAILLESIIASFTNSLIIALQIVDPVTAIISAAISFVCLSPFVYFFLSRGHSHKAISHKIQDHIQTLSIYVAFSVIPGQTYYLLNSQLFKSPVNKWTFDGLFPFTMGLMVSILILQISAFILKRRRELSSFR
jgi:hypothetical protein